MQDLLRSYFKHNIQDSGKIHFRTNTRVQLCAKVFEKFPPLFAKFHNSRKVQQINAVPSGSRCFVTGQVLNSGIQLIFSDEHICLHTSQYLIWYHYFRIRHFPDYIMQLVQNWILFNNVPNCSKGRDTLISSHWVSTANTMWCQSVNILENFLNNYNTLYTA